MPSVPAQESREENIWNFKFEAKDPMGFLLFIFLE